jgi:hypothetical protein
MVENYIIAIISAHAPEFRILDAKNQFLYFIMVCFVIQLSKRDEYNLAIFHSRVLSGSVVFGPGCGSD